MEKVDQLLEQLVLSDEQLEQICSILIHEFKRGLHRETNTEANVKMYPTYVKSLCPTYQSSSNDVHVASHFAEPDEGKFLALDLGGTNFRVVLVELEQNDFHMDSETFAVPQNIMLGTGEQLFEHIAECLSQFVEKRPTLKGHQLPLGFTFSFPCQQEGLRRAKLISWTKGFKCSGVEGQDVVELLRSALTRRPHINIEVMAVVNDTTGTLMSCAFNNRDCRVGLIVGTGTNACYVETLDEVHMAQGDESNGDDTDAIGKMSNGEQVPHHAQQIVVNTEWGAFGDNGCLDFVRTPWDNLVDVSSCNIGRQRFEKMISGMYIGELVRLVLADLAFNHKLLFADCHSANNYLAFIQRHHRMLKPYDFNTKYVSLIESDAPGQFGKTRHALHEAFGIDWATDLDCRIVQSVCVRVSTRAAHLVSAAVAALLNRMRRPYTTVGVDGSVFRYHPHFHRLMNHKTKQLTRPEFGFDLEFSEDGSGRGAALVAAVACKQRRISRELITRANRCVESVEC